MSHNLEHQKDYTSMMKEVLKAVENVTTAGIRCEQQYRLVFQISVRELSGD